MIKRQIRIQRMNRVLHEYLAAETAARWLARETDANPSFGDMHGWPAKGGIDFVANLQATYIIRIYAEFEACLRDYWQTFRKRNTRPQMYQLVNDAIPTVMFPQDIIDMADQLREYRNFLVHDNVDNPTEAVQAFSVQDAKKHLCAYTAFLDPAWI